MNLLILDHNFQLANVLKRTFARGDSANVQISIFHDLEECNQKIEAGSHVLILDYPSGKENPAGSTQGLESFNILKMHHPSEQVILISSGDALSLSKEEILGQVQEYVLRNINRSEANPAVPGSLTAFYRKYMLEVCLAAFIAIGAILFIGFTLLH